MYRQTAETRDNYFRYLDASDLYKRMARIQSYCSIFHWFGVSRRGSRSHSYLEYLIRRDHVTTFDVGGVLEHASHVTRVQDFEAHRHLVGYTCSLSYCILFYSFHSGEEGHSYLRYFNLMGMKEHMPQPRDKYSIMNQANRLFIGYRYRGMVLYPIL